MATMATDRVVKEEPEDLPDDFFDEFSTPEFIAGLSVVDSWDGKRGKPTEEDLRNLLRSRKEEAAREHRDGQQLRRSRSPLRRRSRGPQDRATRRDVDKTNRDIKKDKECKVKEYLAKRLNMDGDVLPPGTELDDYYEQEKPKHSPSPTKQKDKRPSISPLRDRKKERRPSISPLRDRHKDRRPSISPLRDRYKDRRPSISPLRERKKNKRQSVSPVRADRHGHDRVSQNFRSRGVLRRHRSRTRTPSPHRDRRRLRRSHSRGRRSRSRSQHSGSRSRRSRDLFNEFLLDATNLPSSGYSQRNVPPRRPQGGFQRQSYPNEFYPPPLMGEPQPPYLQGSVYGYEAGPQLGGPMGPMGGPPMGGHPMIGPMGGPQMGDPAMSGHQMAGPSMSGHPMGGPPMGGLPMGGPPMGGPPMGGPPMSGPPMGGPPMGGPPMGGHPMGDMGMSRHQMGNPAMSGHLMDGQPLVGQHMDGPGMAPGDPYNYPQMQVSMVPAPEPVPPPSPVVASRAPSTPIRSNDSQPADSLEKLLADGKISKDDYLKLVPKSRVPVPVDSKEKVDLLKRCNDAVAALGKLHLPNRLIMNPKFNFPEQKAIVGKFLSPLKRQPMVIFNFTSAKSNALQTQNKQLVDSIINTLGMQQVVTTPAKKKKNNLKFKDASIQTITPFCEVCEIRKHTNCNSKGTSIDMDHFSTSVHTQVIDVELASSKTTFTPGGNISESGSMSLSHLTPAQLIVSQLAARAKKLESSSGDIPENDQYTRRLQANSQHWQNQDTNQYQNKWY